MLKTEKLSDNQQSFMDVHLQEKISQNIHGSSNSIPKRQQSDYAPLSLGQQQMWLLSQFVSDMPIYNESLTVNLPGRIDAEVLRKSLNAFVERHEIWRTTFPLVDGQPVQMVHPILHLSLSVIDLRAHPRVEQEAKALQLATEQAKAMFDLTRLPLVRAMLVHFGDDEHRLYITLHHMLFDSTIYHVFLSELSKHYEAIMQGVPVALPALSIQYSDFAVWQNEQLQSNLFKDQLVYWKQQLANVPALELPTDQPRLLQQTYHGAHLSLSLTAELVEGLKRLSHNSGTTFYMVLVATFNVLLQRFSGQDDILVGTMTSDPMHHDVQQLVGPFENTVALRTNMSGNITFLDLLGRVRDVILDADMHRDIPFEHLAKELHVGRDMALNSLLQVLITLNPSCEALPSGWTMTQSEVETDATNFDITLSLDDQATGFKGWLGYNTDLWTSETMQRLVDHWYVLLEAVIADPKQYVANLPILTSAEREQMLVKWNDTAVPNTTYTSIHQQIEQQVVKTPEAIAVIFEDNFITYQELNQSANRLAHRLIAMGVQSDMLVGVCMERSIEMSIALLAILKAGGAYVPLDPDYPSDRLAYMIGDAQVSLVLTQTALNELITDVQTLAIDADEAYSAADFGSDNLAIPVHLKNIAYMIYTSGSTGRPKGVMIDHQSLCVRLQWAQQTCPMGANDVVLFKTTYSFDPSVYEIFWPLSMGAKLLIAAPQGQKDHGYLLSLIQEYEVSLLNFSPFALGLFIQEPEWRNCRSVRLVMCGGEALPPDVVEQFYAHNQWATLNNMYGPTEATIFATAWQCERDKPLQILPIGHPVAETEIYLLDEHMQPVPIGVAGELYIGSKLDGAGLARGYHRRPDLTAERFVPDPFGTEPGARLYRTGDLARYRSDGAIEYLGRVDFQVKLHGFRIELGEIETVLLQQPGVQQAIALVYKDGSGNQFLVAYLVSNGERLVTDTLRTSLKEVLPDYMVPTAFVYVDEFPMTINSKVDRKALPAPDLNRAIIEADNYVAPTEIIHYQLLNIWEELHTVRPIGIRDNFFHLGGHSLLAARLIARIEQVFGKKISLSALFAGPTIEDLTHLLQEQAQSGPRSPLIPVQITGSKKPFFFLHGDWTGGAYYCFTLARQAGPDQPFYVLEPYVFNDSQEIPTIESMAASYLKLIRSVQSEGPYNLGGYCNGGIIAYEIAQQLKDQGEQVDFLALVDPAGGSLPKGFINLFNHVPRLAEKFQWSVYLRLRHIYIRKVRPLLLRFSRTSDEQLLKGIELLIEQDKNFTHLFPPLQTLMKDYDTVFSWALQHYTLKPYQGKSTYIWSSEALTTGDRDFWVNKVEVKETASHIISGTHYGILVDEIQAFAESLGSSLNQVTEQKLLNC